MKAKDIVVGGKYVAKVSGKLTTVRVDAIRLPALGNSRQRYDVTNLTTGRKTTFRSAARLLRAAGDPTLEGRLKRLAERGAAGLITAEEQNRQHAAILADEQQRRGLPEVEMTETINTLSIFIGGPQNAKRVFRKASVGTIGVDARIVYFENRDGEWVEIAAKDIPPYQPMSDATRTMS